MITLFQTKITSKLSTNKDGVKGVIAATYVLIPKKQGKISINTERFLSLIQILKSTWILVLNHWL